MGDVLSHGAIVRPRVMLRPEDGPRLLEDVVTELADELPPGLVWLIGGPGSGKSTAIAHLAALYAEDRRLAFFDEPAQQEIERVCDDCVVFAASSSPRGRRGIVLRLLNWNVDDLVEYLLAVHPQHCNAVMRRLGKSAQKAWIPELARVALDRLAVEPAESDPQSALIAEVESRLRKPAHAAVAAEYCLARAADDLDGIHSAAVALSRIGCPQNVISMLRHPDVQIPLAARQLVAALSSRKSLRKLERRLPPRLIQLVGEQCREVSLAVQRLRGILNSFQAKATHPMAASILSIADPNWRPSGDADRPCYLPDGLFCGVNWSMASLAHANLRKADLSDACLVGVNLLEADATGVNFSGADLTNARMIGLRAARANFSRATLAHAKLAIAQAAHASFTAAKLSGANLVKADLSSTDLTEADFTRADLFCARLVGAVLAGTNFTDAKLEEAYLTQADLRTAVLDGASFKSAYMTHVQMEDVQLTNAQLHGTHLDYAHLTGSMFPSADLREAKLTFAQLAEIEWPGADLRGADLFGASFHMGSSRSGLVGSPIACEGSKTGFYTDDREQMYFKRPEEIRKANLRGADLRGARLDNVDFYLVDLRDAQLSSQQLAQVRQTGGILDDWESR